MICPLSSGRDHKWCDEKIPKIISRILKIKIYIKSQSKSNT